MSLVIRLQRFGKTNNPFYHVVVADSRFARNGRFIERVGHYAPTTNPSTFQLNVERMAHWYKVGARPSNTVANLLKVQKVDLGKI